MSRALAGSSFESTFDRCQHTDAVSASPLRSVAPRSSVDPIVSPVDN